MSNSLSVFSRTSVGTRSLLAFSIQCIFAPLTVCAQTELPAVQISATRSTVEKYQLPNTTESTTAEHIAETVNALDAPDALKYIPSLMVRKRDSADFGGATLATRIWGVSYSAKSMVLVDGMPVSTQLFNDNNYGPPKWFVVSPDEIDRIDVLYGPFSAAYSGNSMGAVVDITTRKPSQPLEASAGATEALQTFHLYGTDAQYKTQQVSGMLGGKTDGLSWRIFANHEDAYTQPRSFGYSTTTGVSPYSYVLKDGTTGNFYDGANGILHGVSNNANLKFNFDLDAVTQLSFTTGIFTGDTSAHAESYMNGGVFCPGSAPCTTLASGVYTYQQEQYVNGLALRSNTQGRWDYDLNLSNINYDRDLQRTAGYLNNDGTAVNGVSGKAGTITDMGGTGWTNLDARLQYRPAGVQGAHQISFGLHQDYNKLSSQKYNAVDWMGSDPSGSGNTLAALTRGISETQGLWLQDAIHTSDRTHVTIGARYENWTSHDGQIYSSTAGLGAQPSAVASANVDHFSPKLSVLFDVTPTSSLSLSAANAMRFPTLGELYNIASCTSNTGCSTTQYLIVPPASIKPEEANTLELAYNLQRGESNYRVSLFSEDLQNALISQYGNLTDTNTSHFYSYWMNVNRVRSNGLELSADVRHFIWDRLDLGGSLTLVDSKIADDAGYTYVGSTRKSVVGNLTPGVSPVRAKFIATYRPDDKLSISVGGNYLQQFYSSLANNDVYANTYQGFSGYFVMDMKVRYKMDRHWVASGGIDNLFDQQTFFYHAFPERTFVANLKYTY